MLDFLNIKNMSDEEILKAIVFVAPFFQQIAKEDFMIDVCTY
ncbi:hypothetical protein [Aquibacillus halophilus]|nr:hypothetical protein [Aquibacillus halophilus]